MARLMVVMAGIFETGFAVLLKQSHGITRWHRRSASPSARSSASGC